MPPRAADAAQAGLKCRNPPTLRSPGPTDAAPGDASARALEPGSCRNGISSPLPEELFVELLCLRAWGDAEIGA
jgi:hypothetical protein